MEKRFVITVSLWNVWEDHFENMPDSSDIVPFEGRMFKNLDEAYEFSEEMENNRPLDTWNVREVLVKENELYEQVDGEYIYHGGAWFKKVGNL